MKENIWQVQEAKNKFSSLIEKSIKEGPQIVCKRNKETVVIISVDDYRNLIGKQKNIIDFFQSSPLAEEGLVIDRNKDYPREIDL